MGRCSTQRPGLTAGTFCDSIRIGGRFIDQAPVQLRPVVTPAAFRAAQAHIGRVHQLKAFRIGFNAGRNIAAGHRASEYDNANGSSPWKEQPSHARDHTPCTSLGNITADQPGRKTAAQRFTSARNQTVTRAAQPEPRSTWLRLAALSPGSEQGCRQGRRLRPTRQRSRRSPFNESTHRWHSVEGGSAEPPRATLVSVTEKPSDVVHRLTSAAPISSTGE